ncbi:glutamate-gated chloride channel subunit beta-like [Ixodes scapularis]|uniref:glutamate-gated chloride channel subunit beta-like n=1 Tax=Ixodes scapularis TaxID=6945 RepID=UPI001A9E169F|nr:glutamate-gated chloride channel subunit beta-like [Ixodes scapularis]
MRAPALLVSRASPGFELVLLLLGILRPCATQALSPEEDLYKRFFSSSYNKAIAPKSPDTNGSEVYVQLDLTFVSDVNARSLDFDMQTWVAFLWKDTRLNLEALRTYDPPIPVLPDHLAKGIWQPTVSFDRAGDAVAFDPADIFIRSDGYLLSLRRINFHVHCFHEGSDTGLDSQPESGSTVCDFLIRLLYEADCNCALIWVGDKVSPFYGVLESVVRRPEARPLVSVLVAVEPSSSTKSGGTPGSNETIFATFKFVRTSWSFLTSAYLPSTLTVVVSWMSFWVDVGAASSRLTLGIACLLAITVQTGLGRIANPFGSQVRPGDMYTFMSTMMIFLTVVEFAMAHGAYRSQAEVQKRGSEDVVSQPSYRICKSPMSNEVCVVCDKATQTETSYLAFKTTDLDELSRLLFPIAFFIFACLHMVWYAGIPE